jgi:hypothetical protein
MTAPLSPQRAHSPLRLRMYSPNQGTYADDTGAVQWTRVLLASGPRRSAGTEEGRPMGWVWIVAAVWVPLAIGVAVLIGRSVRLADRKAADGSVEEVNVLVDRPPLTIASGSADLPVDGTAGVAVTGDSPAETEPPAPRAGRDAPTIPGIPAARPPVGRPPVPHPIWHRPGRRSGHG